jgi:hypothetical protein
MMIEDRSKMFFLKQTLGVAARIVKCVFTERVGTDGFTWIRIGQWLSLVHAVREYSVSYQMQRIHQLHEVLGYQVVLRTLKLALTKELAKCTNDIKSRSATVKEALIKYETLFVSKLDFNLRKRPKKVLYLDHRSIQC